MNKPQPTMPIAMMLAILINVFACAPGDPPAKKQADEPEATSQPQNVVVYSSVGAAQISPSLQAFTAETGIKVQLVVDEYSNLVDKIGNHRSDPVADLFVAGNVTDLLHATENDVFRPTYDAAEIGQPAENLRDPEDYWFPLSVRARVVVYNTGLVGEDELASVNDYASLRGPIWRERLCVSSSRVTGNRSLISMLIDEYDKREAELIVRGWLANDKDIFYSDDFALLQATADGNCQITIADTSVLAAIVSEENDVPLAAHYFPDSTQVLVDITGAGVTRHAQNPDAAAVLMQWLGSERPNAVFAAAGFEFPANASASTASSIQQWSEFVANPMRIAQLGFGLEEAVLLAERARYP